MTKKEAQKACRWFQREIGLAGWKIEVFLRDKPLSMCGDETRDDTKTQLGHSWTHLRLHIVQVWINPDPTILTSNEDVDEMLTLMHELLHGLFESIDIPYNRLQEHAIDRLSHILAAQYRQWRQA